MKKRKTKAEKMQEAMIERAVQKAVVGFLIPIMSIPKIYSRAEFEGAKPGVTEASLEATMREYLKTFPGVTEAA